MYWPVGAASSLDATSGIDNSTSSEDKRIIAVKSVRHGNLFAAITSSALIIFQSKPAAVVTTFRRSEESLKSYGSNVDVFAKPDALIFIVQTDKDYLVMFNFLMDTNVRVYMPSFSSSKQHPNYRLGSGESGGVRQCFLKFRVAVKVDARIASILALEDEVEIATIKSPAIQRLSWHHDADQQIQNHVLQLMDWLPKKSSIIQLVYDRPMNLYAWLLADGSAFAVQKSKDEVVYNGFCFHKPMSEHDIGLTVAINARFSLIAVACTDGSISIYNARDYAGNITLSHQVVAQAPHGEHVLTMWSPDGYCLLVGYRNGWSMWSVYGQELASSFKIDTQNDSAREPFLDFVCDAAWLCNGTELVFVTGLDTVLWVIQLARSPLVSSLFAENIERPYLISNELIHVYRGHNTSEADVINQDAVLWRDIRIPSEYLADNYPIRYSCISADGRYLAVAGRRGLAHISLHSDRWKVFINDSMEQDFSVRGGMSWYHHILIAAVEADDFFEIRLYSRETELDNQRMLHLESLSSAVVVLTLVEDSLLVFTADNTLYHFLVTTTKNTVELMEVGRVSFNGIIRSPARVRAITWIVPEDHLLKGNPVNDVKVASIFLLVDAKLVILKPKLNEAGEVKFELRVLMQKVEYFHFSRSRGETNSTLFNYSLWAFTGTSMHIWQHTQPLIHDTNVPSVKVNLDFYPLSSLPSKGIILGVEPEMMQRRSSSFSVFRVATRTQLFLPSMLRDYLRNNAIDEAIAFAIHFQKLSYFGHTLEVLLHDVLDDEANTSSEDDEAILPRVVRFLNPFPEMLDVIAACTRKTEMRSWGQLFKYVGSPQELFERCMAMNLLKTAGAYLLILHNIEQLSESSNDMQRLFRRAFDEGEWDLLKELSRFLMALDSSGNTLRLALRSADLPVDQGVDMTLDGSSLKDVHFA